MLNLNSMMRFCHSNNNEFENNQRTRAFQQFNQNVPLISIKRIEELLNSPDLISEQEIEEFQQNFLSFSSIDQVDILDIMSNNSNKRIIIRIRDRVDIMKAAITQHKNNIFNPKQNQTRYKDKIIIRIAIAKLKYRIYTFKKSKKDFKVEMLVSYKKVIEAIIEENKINEYPHEFFFYIYELYTKDDKGYRNFLAENIEHIKTSITVLYYNYLIKQKYCEALSYLIKFNEILKLQFENKEIYFNFFYNKQNEIIQLMYQEYKNHRTQYIILLKELVLSFIIVAKNKNSLNFLAMMKNILFAVNKNPTHYMRMNLNYHNSQQQQLIERLDKLFYPKIDRDIIFKLINNCQVDQVAEGLFNEHNHTANTLFNNHYYDLFCKRYKRDIERNANCAIYKLQLL